ncbi:hypothetical protein BDP27DRAFT_1416372 [Rhodocollybia butyracea]|uniref:C2H2-type domain-containing protein n=1 Tax=Rhodocollybia butyracea TaxID=206335 RepID=A0A9P5UCU0_9AGAR|nr:hypothetical protein BDP27DRAFT_1416372 [Rhodocollybia butyracea]
MSSLPSSISAAAETTLAGDGFSPAQSLLSLSIAASSVTPIPISSSVDSSASSSGPSPPVASVGGRNQRRLSSAGKARRRLSDARDAAVRPLPAPTTALSLATLSLSPSPVTSEISPAGISTSFTAATQALIGAQPESPVAHSSIPISSVEPATSVPLHVGSAPTNASTMPFVINSKPISIKGKKRGMEHKCEGCSKIYRHPSCLIKHRWEHTPHWRESSKYVLSKHQQVQLLEAAAILSHFSADSATGTSLPEDRSLWPSFLSGGSLPVPEGTGPDMVSSSVPTTNVLHSASGSSSVSSGVTPARSPSVGPRLHDYTIPTTDVTQVRPGLYMMGGSSAPSSVASPLHPSESHSEIRSLGPGIGYGRAPSVSSSLNDSPGDSPRRAPLSNFAPSSSSYTSTSFSIPRSSLRSGSVFSESERSSSLEEEDEQVEDARMRVYHDYEFEPDVDIDGDGNLDVSGHKRDSFAFSGRGYNNGKNFDEYGFEYERGSSAVAIKAVVPLGLNSTKEEDWEMEMDMD